ncbi:PREDICTED: uncharacterized protein LOC107114964 [Gekko japonicus]|uniref:Uncharacterized protein LOC107114964 n=1 Tax=Gekko japonicus TaxID=146911 RepID=A0ABM1KEC0_GEKJA|nr:PREDICTED: uncharacterized protein LOC107114964 [Gekko japonicus]
MQEKMSHMQELDSASQLNLKPEFEGLSFPRDTGENSGFQGFSPRTPPKVPCCSQDNHQMGNYPNRETSLPSTTSFQSTTFCEQRENHSGLKDRFFDTMQNTSHQREPDSLVYLDTSAQRTKSPPIQLIAQKPDTLEPCQDESLLKMESETSEIQLMTTHGRSFTAAAHKLWNVIPQAGDEEKPPDTGDDRQANENAAEVIVTKKEERENLRRTVFTKRKPLPNIKRYPWKNSQESRMMEEETQRLRPSILDFLNKYCIIKPERLSIYERVFLKYCSNEDSEIPGDQKLTETSSTNFNCIPGGFDNVEEIFIQQKAKENIDVGRKIQMVLESGSISDQLEKTQFQIKQLLGRKKHIVDTVQDLQDRRMQFLATVNDQQSHATKQKVQKKRKKMNNTRFLQDLEGKGDNPCGLPSCKLPIASDVPLKQVEEATNST